jgi:hypothetical protein
MSRHSAHDRRWCRLRAANLRANPTCEWLGCSKPATTEHSRSTMAALGLQMISKKSSALTYTMPLARACRPLEG